MAGWLTGHGYQVHDWLSGLLADWLADWLIGWRVLDVKLSHDEQHGHNQACPEHSVLTQYCYYYYHY